MLNLTMTIKDEKATINKKTSFIHDKYLEEYTDAVLPKIEEKYISLTSKLNNKKTIEIIKAKDKNKDSYAHWKIGKEIYNFIMDINTEGINISNLYDCLSISIAGFSEFWINCVKFYGVNTDGSYNKFPWKLSMVLLKTPNPKTRKFLIYAFDNKYIDTRDELESWKVYFERKGQIKEVSKKTLRYKVLMSLSEGKQTREGIAEKLKVPEDSIRGRITELRNFYQYPIVNDKDGFYSLPDNYEAKRTQKIKEDIEKIEKIKTLLNL